MFETPTLFRKTDRFEIYLPVGRSETLMRDLANAGFTVTRFEGEFALVDLNADVRTDLAILDLPLSVNALELRAFLRRWNANAAT